MNRNLFFLLALLAGAAVPIAAATPGTPAPAAKAPAAATNQVAATNASAPGVVEETDADPIVRPGDKLSLRIKEDPYGDIQPETTIVSPAGRAEFHVSRKYKQMVALEVGGKPVSEAKRSLKTKLDADYYVNASLELSLTPVFGNTKAGKVLIYGEGVKSQTLVLVPGEEKRILEAILGAGTSEFSQLKRVKLLRRDPKTDKIEIKVINIEEMKKTGSEEKNILLQDGDKIEIPERNFVF